MFTYTITYNEKKVAENLSRGETNQFILDFLKERKNKVYMGEILSCFNFYGKIDEFEEYLYEYFELDDLVVHIGKNIIEIEKKEDF